MQGWGGQSDSRSLCSLASCLQAYQEITGLLTSIGLSSAGGWDPGVLGGFGPSVGTLPGLFLPLHIYLVRTITALSVKVEQH